MRNFGSVWRGLRVMSSPFMILRNWTIKFDRIHDLDNFHIRFTKVPISLWPAMLFYKLKYYFWAQWWTPTWHEGRGPYISIGLGIIAIYRGY